jgi:2',3'-cyclic-nucleotide 2'-phosphodiesterase (5'-nucleotidase family)
VQAESFYTVEQAARALRLTPFTERIPPEFGMVQVSGLSFTYDPSMPVGSRVDETSIIVKAAGKPLDPAANYRVVINDFMYNGGDNYTMFKQGTNPVIYSHQLLYDVVAGYVGRFSPINQQIEGRITTP